ncbi:MAG: DUF6364 family protein [Balneolaceae bacterium]
MSKETINLSVEKDIKQRAKKIARNRGMSVSRFFEMLITEQEDPEVFKPPPGSGTAQFINAIPESDKLENYDYKKLKKDMFDKRYGIE